MPGYERLLDPFRDARQAIADASDPTSLFRDATWDQVGKDKDLTDFLQRSMDPDGRYFRGDVDALKRSILKDAEEQRGGGLWLTLFNTPRRYPESIQEHRYLNLLERLYLSAPGGYGKKVLYGSNLVAQDARKEHIAQRSATGLGLSLAVGLTAWWVWRRKAVAESVSESVSDSQAVSSVTEKKRLRGS